MNFFDKSELIKGEIAFFGLSKWYVSEFTKDERFYMNEKYTPMGFSPGMLSEIELMSKQESDALYYKLGIDYERDSVIFLTILAGWFDSIKDRDLAIRILKKAEELIDETISFFHIHLLYGQIIEIHYKNRIVNPKSLDKVLETCKKDIEIAPFALKVVKASKNFNGFIPGHKGYERLAIYKEQVKNFQETIEICAKALDEGWRGDWQKRIDRCRCKIKQINN